MDGCGWMDFDSLHDTTFLLLVIFLTRHDFPMFQSIRRKIICSSLLLSILVILVVSALFPFVLELVSLVPCLSQGQSIKVFTSECMQIHTHHAANVKEAVQWWLYDSVEH
ncbi:hypothetical protein CHARACLAT_013153 [Characodon lateralis]|uniref:Uncharacterized protein n=1 Tax=Characodon lateralis TaxID=208331 RepID=A0ABU7EIN1_9TELE|nr:hypothetical protein [Characodon lateralis]